MSHIQPYLPGELLRSDARRTSRRVSRGRSTGEVRASQVDTEADVAMAKADAYTAATGMASAAVVRVAQAQRQLEQLAPEASGRLAMLGDDHALAMAEILGDLRRDIRRR